MGIPVANTVWFTAGSTGTSDFSDGAALTGYRNLAGGSLTNAAVYTYRAEHPTDKTIWENGSGAVNTGTNVLARTTIEGSSTGSKISWAVAPVVFLTQMKRDFDLLAPLASPAFTGAGSISGVWSVTDTTEAGSGTGSIVASGGIYAAKAIRSGSTTAATSTTTGSGIFGGGIGVAGKGYFGGALNVTDTTAASSTSTGSGIFGGGIGVAGNVYSGGEFRSIGGAVNAFLVAASGSGAYLGTRSNDFLNFRTNDLDRFQLTAAGGLIALSATGGDKGAGTVNAISVYDDNVLLTCFGIEYLIDGKINVAKWDGYSPTGRNELVHKFDAMTREFDPRDAAQYIRRMHRDRALPGMPTEGEWRHNGLGLGEMHNRLWLSTELLASAFVGHVAKITARLDAMENRH